MRFVIDRFEGDYAVCEDENRNMINIARDRLPAGAKERDVLNVDRNDIRIDTEETRAREKKMEKMLNGLWEQDKNME